MSSTGASAQAEIASLQQQQKALEASLQTAEQRLQQYDELFQHLPISIAIWHLDALDDPRSFRLTAANARNQQTAGFDLRPQIGRRPVEIFPGVPEPLLQVYVDILRSGQSRDLGEITAADDDEQLGGVTMT